MLIEGRINSEHTVGATRRGEKATNGRNDDRECNPPHSFRCGGTQQAHYRNVTPSGHRREIAITLKIHLRGFLGGSALVSATTLPISPSSIP